MQRVTKISQETSQEIERVKKLMTAAVDLCDLTFDDTSVEVDPYSVLSGSDLIGSTVQSLLESSCDNAKVFKNYFIYSTLPRDTIIQEQNLLHAIEEVTPTLLKLISTQNLNKEILEIKNQGWELWWDNAPVKFEYKTDKEPYFDLTFQNGRNIKASAKDISLCSELSSNIQLSVAACLSTFLDFKLDISKTTYNKEFQTYNFLPVIEDAYLQQLQCLYDYLKDLETIPNEFIIPNTNITFDILDLTFLIDNKKIPFNYTIYLVLIRTFLMRIK